MKKMIQIYLSMILMFCFTIPINAENQNGEFASFVVSGLSADNFTVYNSQNNDITSEFLEIYDNNGVSSAHEYLASLSGSMQYTIYEDNPTSSTYAVDNAVNVYSEKYEISPDTTGNFTKEWRIRLSGTYYEDGNTGLIKRTSSPTVTLVWENFGAAFSPYMNSVSTSSFVSDSSYAVFSCSYHMYATLLASIGIFPVGRTFDFYSHSYSFTAS